MVYKNPIFDKKLAKIDFLIRSNTCLKSPQASGPKQRGKTKRIGACNLSRHGEFNAKNRLSIGTSLAEISSTAHTYRDFVFYYYGLALSPWSHAFLFYLLHLLILLNIWHSKIFKTVLWSTWIRNSILDS